jgi:hypothetical protein
MELVEETRAEICSMVIVVVRGMGKGTRDAGGHESAVEHKRWFFLVQHHSAMIKQSYEWDGASRAQDGACRA